MLEGLLILLPLAGTGAAFFLRKSPLRRTLAAVSCLLAQCALALFLTLAPWRILPVQLLSLDALGATLLIALSASLAFTLYWTQNADEDYLPWLGLAFHCGVTVVALLTRQLAVAGLILSATSLVPLYSLRSRAASSEHLKAGLGALLAASLAGGAFLTIIPLTEAYNATRDPQLVPLTGAMLTVGMGLLMAVVPFHLWLTRLADRVPPVVQIWMSVHVGCCALVLLVSSAQDYPWLTVGVALTGALRPAAAAAAIIAGFLAATCSDLRRATLYAWASGLAIALAGVACGTSPGAVGALVATFSAAGATLLLVVSGDAGREEGAEESGESRWTAAILVIGAMVFAGLPPLGGFSGRWLVYEASGAHSAWLAAALLFASALLLLTFARHLRIALARSVAVRNPVTRGRLAAACLVLLALLALGVYPAPLLAALASGAGGFPPLS